LASDLRLTSVRELSARKGSAWLGLRNLRIAGSYRLDPGPGVFKFVDSSTPAALDMLDIEDLRALLVVEALAGSTVVGH
jgi:hypothetical protein